MALVTIQSATIPNWQGASDTVALFILVNASFTAATGTIYPATHRDHLPYGGRQSIGAFYLSAACTVSGNNLTIPAIELDSTEDSPDNPSATFSAVLWDTSVGQPIQPFGTFPAFALAPSPTPTSWAVIFEAETL